MKILALNLGKFKTVEFADRLVNPEFVKATGGGKISWSLGTKITCPHKTVAKREFWYRVRDELFGAE